MPLEPETFRVRYRADGRGHYESFYLKANHPGRKLGLWLKLNLLEPVGRAGAVEGELWGVFLDGERGRHVVARQLVPPSEVDAREGSTLLRIGPAHLDASGESLAEHASVSDGRHTVRWKLTLTPKAAPLAPLPYRWMYEGGFPRKKIYTPIPVGALSGWLEVDGVRHDLEGWSGLHGHNWGLEHAQRYAYGNARFPDGAYVDGFSARIRLGPVTSPWLTAVVFRFPDGRELPFNLPRRWLSGSPRLEDLAWSVDLPGQAGHRLQLQLRMHPEDRVGLLYRYPDGRVGYCANTKFAEASLRVEQRGRVLYEGRTEQAELETFGPEPAPGLDYHRLTAPAPAEDARPPREAGTALPGA